jgi:hypothetical protein
VNLLSCLPPQEQAAMQGVIDAVGRDTDTLLNTLHRLAVVVAVFAEVEPENFAAGVKHHWNDVADLLNAGMN